jgi:hypothetical protein
MSACDQFVVEVLTNGTVVVQETAPPQIIEIVSVGPQGPEGPEGPVGPEGPQSWMDIVARPSAASGTATVGGVGGKVRTHTKVGLPDVFRFIPDPYDPTVDAFYSTFTAGVLSDLIVTRG